MYMHVQAQFMKRLFEDVECGSHGRGGMERNWPIMAVQIKRRLVQRVCKLIKFPNVIYYID